VIAHYDIGIHLEAIALSILLQPPKVILPIRITAKNDLPLIASTDHMLKCPGKFNSWLRAMVPHDVIHQLNAI
jgi:hypothetical protein